MIDLLWHWAYFFKESRSGGSGFLSDVSVGEHDGKTFVVENLRYR